MRRRSLPLPWTGTWLARKSWWQSRRHLGCICKRRERKQILGTCMLLHISFIEMIFYLWREKCLARKATIALSSFLPLLPPLPPFPSSPPLLLPPSSSSSYPSSLPLHYPPPSCLPSSSSLSLLHLLPSLLLNPLPPPSPALSPQVPQTKALSQLYFNPLVTDCDPSSILKTLESWEITYKDYTTLHSKPILPSYSHIQMRRSIHVHQYR